MATYIGYYRTTDGFNLENQERSRAEGPTGPPAKFMQLVVDLPGRLPAGATIVGSWGPVVNGPVFAGGAPPNVMIVEADDPAAWDSSATTTLATDLPVDAGDGGRRRSAASRGVEAGSGGANGGCAQLVR